LIDLNVPSEAAHRLRHELGGRCFAPALLRGVDARQLHQFPG
jgi:hypothetical protein